MSKVSVENKFLKITISALSAAALIFFASLVLAQTDKGNTPDIKFPVSELGNCKSETDCRNFCDKPDNTAACLSFAEKNDLMSADEIKMARKFSSAGNVGPGGCSSKDSCESYCNDILHIDECVSFAEKNDLIPPKDLEEAKKVQSAIKRGIRPPPCGNKKACDNYCEDANHMEECINFAQEAGLMSDQERAESQKVLQAIKRGVKPPPCKGREACDQYCQQPENIETCMNFALEAGLMGDKEKDDAQKMLSAIKKGVKPPNCRGKDECDSYCREDTHFDECTNFAEAAGFMNSKEADMARKTRGKGPGDCKSQQECEAFCNDPTNQETCFKFASEHDLIPEDQVNQMKEGVSKMRKGLDNTPSEVQDCLKSKLGENIIEKIQSGELTPGQQIGDQMKNCFENFQPQEMKSPGMMPPRENNEPTQNHPLESNGEFRGPEGGCSTPEECQNFCKQNPEQCKTLNQFPPQFSPPPEFENKLPEQNQNQFFPTGSQLPPVEQEPKIQPNEQFQPPPPETELPPQSLLNNVYLGSIMRFLMGAY